MDYIEEEPPKTAAHLQQTGVTSIPVRQPQHSDQLESCLALYAPIRLSRSGTDTLLLFQLKWSSFSDRNLGQGLLQGDAL